MKKFSKILAVVFAFIMIAGLLSPLAEAKAATSPKINYTSKTIFVGGSKVNSYKGTVSLKITNRPAKWSITWSSSNENVATVKYGTKKYFGKVTAVAPGTATITAKVTDKKTKKTTELSCKVTVKKNASKVEIVGKDKIPESFDIGHGIEKLTARKYDEKGNEGSKYVTDYIAWKSSNTSVAKVTKLSANTCKITVVGAGESTITCYTYQGSATKSIAKATATDTFVIKGKSDTNALGTIKQTKPAEFTITYGSDMSKTLTKSNLKVTATPAGGTAKNVDIKSLTFDSTGKVATVTLLSSLADKTVVDVTYTDAAGKASKKTFTASYGDIKTFTVTAEDGTTRAIANQYTKLKYTFFDANGVNVTPSTTTEYDNLVSKQVQVSLDGTSSTDALLVGHQIFFGAANKQATVKATYFTLKTTGDIKVESTAVFTSVSEAETLQFVDYQITNSTKMGSQLSWTTKSTTIAAGDSGYRLVARFKNAAGKYYYTDDASSKFKVQLENELSTSPLFVQPNGALSAFRAGTVTVNIYYDNVALKAVSITISAERAASIISVDKGEQTVSSNPAYSTATYKVTVTDNLGDKMRVTNISDFKVECSTPIHPTPVTTINADGTVSVTLNGVGYAINGASSFQYVITYGKAVPAQFFFTVKDPVGNSTYSLELEDYYDIQFSDDLDQIPQIPLKLYELKNGAKYAESIVKKEANAHDGDYFYRVFLNGSETSKGTAEDGRWLPFVTNAGRISKADLGTYTVLVYKKQGTALNVVTSKVFTLTDTQLELTFTKEKEKTTIPITSGASASTIASIVADMYKVTLGNQTINAAALVCEGYIATDKAVYVPTVKYYESIVINSVTYVIEHVYKLETTLCN